MFVTCRHVQQLREAYLNGELSASLTAEVHAHLLQCPECQQQIEIMQACGDVIAKGGAEPELDSGFALRVLAALPRSTGVSPAAGRRQALVHWGRTVARIGVPAAAAALFFGVLIWPPPHVQPTAVLSDTAQNPLAEEVVSPVLEKVRDTRQAGDDLRSMVDIAVDRPQAKAAKPAPEAKANDAANRREAPSFLEILLQPFNDILNPIGPAEESPASDQDDETIRF